MNFEQYLILIGYKRMVLNTKTFKLEEPGINHFLSTLGDLDYRYIKEGEKTITWGLHEKDKPAILIYPRPKGVFTDDEMNKQLKELEPKEIYDRIR